VSAPLLLNVSKSGVGLLGFQFETPFTADFDAKTAKCVPLGPRAAIVIPVDANLNVHVGERFVANFVSALSTLCPVCT
jgi:hypothetical protein